MKFVLQEVRIIGSLLVAAGLIPLLQQAVVAEGGETKVAASGQAAAQLTADPTVLRADATAVLNAYCVSCHGQEKQKGKVRLDALETIDPVDQQKLYANMREALLFEKLPEKILKNTLSLLSFFCCPFFFLSFFVTHGVSTSYVPNYFNVLNSVCLQLQPT